jgi:hypothetical protein
MIVTCEDWKPFQRNTLQGFCTIRIEDIQLLVKDVAIHTKNGQTWAQLPSKPQVKDGCLVKDNSGKTQYWSTMEFVGREARDAFSQAVIRAINAFSPGAIGGPAKSSHRSAPSGRLPGKPSTPIDLDDAVPF